jgi:hypothetical protein
VTNPVAVLRSCKDGDLTYQMLWFVCPGCKSRKEGDTGLHGLPVNAAVKRPSWAFDGNLEKPTLSPSILSRTEWAGVPFVCHSFLRNGVFEFLGDCTHALKSQNVPMESLPDWFMKD